MSRYYQDDFIFDQDFEDVIIENDEYDDLPVRKGPKLTKKQEQARLRRMEKNRKAYIAKKEAKEAAKHDEKAKLKNKQKQKQKAIEKLKDSKDVDSKSTSKVLSFKNICKQQRINDLEKKKESGRHAGRGKSGKNGKQGGKSGKR